MLCNVCFVPYTGYILSAFFCIFVRDNYTFGYTQIEKRWNRIAYLDLPAYASYGKLILVEQVIFGFTNIVDCNFLL